MMGLVATDMDFVKPSTGKKINWADLADSEDEISGGASSSWSRPSRSAGVSAVRTACAAHLETLENNDDCSTDAPSDGGESPREASKIHFGEVVSEDESMVDSRAQWVQPSSPSYRHDRWRESRWQEEEPGDRWQGGRWHNDSRRSDEQWEDRWLGKPDRQWDDGWTSKSGGQWKKQYYQGAGYGDVSWQASAKRGSKAPAAAASAWEKQAWGKHDGKEDVRRAARKGAAYKKNAVFRKPQCQFIIGIEEEEGFKVKTKLLGPHGKHMKAIAEKSGAKMRLRGRGSGFKEGPEEQESNDPLMLCISALDNDTYEVAKALVQELMEDIYRQYLQYCKQCQQRPPAQLRIQLHEGPREGSA